MLKLCTHVHVQPSVPQQSYNMQVTNADRCHVHAYGNSQAHPTKYYMMDKLQDKVRDFALDETDDSCCVPPCESSDQRNLAAGQSH